MQFLLCSYGIAYDNAVSLTVHFENVQSAEGHILVGIYKDQKSWAKRTPAKEFTISKANIVDGKLTTIISDLEPGIYGLAFLDDENGNEIVDMGWIFPKEGFGFSDYYHNSLALPQWHDFAFSFPERQRINVKFRYLRL